MTDSELIRTEMEGHVLRIVLNRPKKKNAFNLEMLRALAEAYTDFDNDPEARCAVLEPAGDDFTTGLDLAEVGPAVAEGTSLFPEDSVDPLGLFGRERRKPVVCAVRGWCLTIGIELMLAADIAVASDDTRFAQMEVQRGIMPFGGATLRMPQIAGWGNAMQYLLTGDGFDADTAREMGLVQQVVAPDQISGAAGYLAERVAAQAPLAVQATLGSAHVAFRRGPDQALAGLMDEARRLMDTEDAGEGVRSFVERREARFQGK